MSIIARLNKDSTGNFGIMTALLAPVVIGVAGFGMDTLLLMSAKADLQASLDSAALIATSTMINKNGTVRAAEVAGANAVYSNALPKAGFGDVSVRVTDLTPKGKPGLFEATVSATYNVELTGFQRLYGGPSSRQVTAVAVSQSSRIQQTAVSLYFVLDASGSMDYFGLEKESPCPDGAKTCPRKMEALKSAGEALFATFDKLDPKQKLTRLGANSYSTDLIASVNPEWGTSSVRKFFTALSSDGGTNSSTAMKQAVTYMTSTAEKKEHDRMYNEKFERYIVLMTDGANSPVTYSIDTMRSCDEAKRKGVKIISVALIAPPAGKTMLQNCASSKNLYFDVKTSSALSGVFQQIGELARIGNIVTQ